MADQNIKKNIIQKLYVPNTFFNKSLVNIYDMCFSLFL
jgi:hypothetical protein